MKWTTSCATAASNSSSSKEAVQLPPAPHGRRVAFPCRRDERLRRVDGRDRVRAEPGDELSREGAGPAAHVEYALATGHTCQVRQLCRELDGVAAHEAVVRIGCDVERHLDDSTSFAFESRAP